MPTLKQEFIYFNDAVGRTLPNAKMYFYEAGTTTPKNTFTSKSLANANQHPVVADAAGRFPVIWLGVGGYRVVVEDENGVTIHDRDDINVADEQLNATSSIYFKTLADLKLLIAQNGQSVNPGIGDALRTAGETNTTDGLGAEWVVVAAGTGTADDDLFVDLDNGLQAQRLFNQVYGKKTDYLQVSENLNDLGNKASARTNLDVYSKAESDPDPVSGFLAAKFIYTVSDAALSPTLSSATSSIPVDTWTSVGPTGSGATVTWTALDALPSGYLFVDAVVRLRELFGTSALRSVFFGIRPLGSTAVFDETILMSELELNPIEDIGYITTHIRFPVDSNGVFEVRYAGDTSPSFRMLLRGFGI